MMHRNKDMTGALAAVLSALLMGTMGVFAKSTGVDAPLLTFFRLFFGACFMFVFLAATGQVRRVWRWPSWPVVISGVMLAGLIIFYVQAMAYTTMANAVMLLYLAPLAASVLAHFFLNEHLTKLSAALIGLSLIGFMMMMEFRFDISGSGIQLYGMLSGLLSMSCYSAFILVNRMVDEKIHVYTRTFYQLLTGAMVMLPFYMYSTADLTMHNWLWLVGAGFFPGFLAIFCAVLSLNRIPAAYFGTLAYIEPITVIVLGWIFFHESLSSWQIAGCLLILISGVMKTWASLAGFSQSSTVSSG